MRVQRQDQEDGSRVAWWYSSWRRSVSGLNHLPEPERSIFILRLAQSLFKIALLGRHAGLTVRVSSYSATVECEPGATPPEKAACLDLMGTMQAGGPGLFFVRTRDPTLGKNVIIPKRLASGTHAFRPPFAFSASLRSGLLARVLGETDTSVEIATGFCSAVIDAEDGEADKSSWHEMWMAAVAVNVICVQNGKAGTAHKLGEPWFHQSMFDDMLRLRRAGQDVNAFAAFVVVGKYFFGHRILTEYPIFVCLRGSIKLLLFSNRYSSNCCIIKVLY